MELIKGFSKLSRLEKITYLTENFLPGSDFEKTLESFIHEQQELFDDFSENTLSNFLLPFGVAPNFLINNKLYAVPMVTEESSVVAAASRAASFWSVNNGFNAQIINTKKIGHIWFTWDGNIECLLQKNEDLHLYLKQSIADITISMEKRGGGILSSQIFSQQELPNTYELRITFNTVDSMGANFINSCLEAMRNPLVDFFNNHKLGVPNIIMAILSNHTPQCIVTTTVQCNVEQLKPYSSELSAHEFALKFKTAVDIAKYNTHRAVTHNKGILNGIDAVVIATGNDFRAVEAAAHAFAVKNGQYRSLSQCHITDNGIFSFSLTLPLAIGTVGGLTKLHPMASLSMKILQHPNAEELMKIVASVGLANNFAAVASLVTTGIQKGHMKLHLSNILNSLEASDKEKSLATQFFIDKTVSQNSVKTFLLQLREPNL